MACRQFSAKPLSNSMLGYCQQWNFNQNRKLFIHKNASENIVCEVASILSGEDELINRQDYDPVTMITNR